MTEAKIVRITVTKDHENEIIIEVFGDEESDIFDDYIAFLDHEYKYLVFRDNSTQFFLGPEISESQIDSLLESFEDFSRSESYPLKVLRSDNGKPRSPTMT